MVDAPFQVLPRKLVRSSRSAQVTPGAANDRSHLPGQLPRDEQLDRLRRRRVLRGCSLRVY